MANFSYNSVPVIRHSRSRFDLSHGRKTSGNVGTLYPFEVQEVYPGDTFKLHTMAVTRLTSQFLKPVMDNLFLDMYYFYVPSRLLYDKYQNIFGENTESAWANTQEYAVPTVYGTVPEGSVGDYLGLPTKQAIPAGNAVSVLPFRAFAKIYNEWFRDENNIDPMHIQQGAKAASESFNSNAWAPNNYFGKPPHVGKLRDYFTSCLPAPQKGDAPAVFQGLAPVVTGDPHEVSGNPMSLVDDDGSSPLTGNFIGFQNAAGRTFAMNASATGMGTMSAAGFAVPDNLYADMNGMGFTINDLRFAFQYQKMLERQARSGSRFVEYLASTWGVSSGDTRLQRSEFLGGRRAPITIQQVTQTTGAGSNLGDVGAYSLSNGRSRFTKSFVEPGYVIGVYCIRQMHTYQQGIERFWRRSKRIDFYDPVFANIGEQPVYKSELYAGAPSDSVFGYNEAWADLRARQSGVTGQMRSNSSAALDVWHFADEYDNAPTLSQTFVDETPQFVDRTISVQSTEQDQFILDFWIQNIAYRVLPTYSVPSLIDHN